MVKAIFFGNSHLTAYRSAWADKSIRPAVGFDSVFAPINVSVKWMRPLSSYSKELDCYVPNSAIMYLLQNRGDFTDLDGEY